MSSIDDLIAGYRSESKSAPMMDAPKEATKGVTAGSGDIDIPEREPVSDKLISGDLARALGPTQKKRPKTLDEMVEEHRIQKETGKSPTPKIYVPDEAEPGKPAGVGKPMELSVDDMVNEYRVDQEQPLALEDPKSTAAHLQTNKKSGKGVTGLGKPLLYVLGAEENAEVKFLRGKIGLSPESDHLDNTYSNLLKDLGAPDSIMTEAAGLALSIVTAPSTYLSFGTTGVAKVGKAVTLNSRGLKAAQEIAKRRTDDAVMRIQSNVAQKSGKAIEEVVVNPETVNQIARSNFEQVQKELAVKFGEISKQTQGVKMGKDVQALGGNVFDRGGMKFFGKTIITGPEVAKIIDSSGLPRVMSAMSKTKVGNAAKVNAVDPMVSNYKEVKDALGTIFIPNHGTERELVELWDDTQRTARSVYERQLRYTQKSFGKMGVTTKGQMSDFYQSVSEAFGKEELKGKVASKSGDPAVQKAIDRWFGQGEYVGKTSIQKRLAKFAKLVEGDEAVNWFPGIDVRFADKIPDLKMPAMGGPADRAFNRPRAGVMAQYVTDPVKAIALRRTQVAMANLQDKIYDNIKINKLGDPKTFNSIEEAAQAGYVPLTKPYADGFRRALLENKVEPGLFKPNQLYFVKKDFAAQYQRLVTDHVSRMKPWKATIYKLIDKPTRVFKQHVTSLFPSFYARNVTSNIVLNSMSIGGHAVNPVRNKLAMDMIIGSNLDKTIKTAIGEKLTLKQILKEAESEGLLRTGSYISDLGGETLGIEAQSAWDFFLRKANPLSQDFAPSAWGRKLGGAVEDQAKLVNYLTWRTKGLSPKVAAREAQEALFDYSKVTDAEQWFKLVIPFYTFSRKNVEAHMKLMARRPGVIASQMKAFRDLGPTDDEWNEMPKWFKNKAVTRFKSLMLSGYGLPFEDILSLMGADSDILTRGNPLFRYPVEKMAGHDFFSKQPIEEINAAKEFTKVVDWVEDPNVPESMKLPLKKMKNWLELKRDPSSKQGKIIGNPDKLHLLRNTFSSRYQSTLGMLQNEDKEAWETAVRFLLGIVRVEPDAQISLGNQKKEVTREMVRKINKNNLARGIPIYVIVGGKKSTRRKAQKALDDAKDANTTGELEVADEKLDSLVEQEREMNFEE